MNSKHTRFIHTILFLATMTAHLMQNGAAVKGFVPKNDAERNEYCYTYLKGDLKTLFQAMCTNARHFKIAINGNVPQVYWSSRNDVVLQLAREMGPEKEYDPLKRNGARPSLSHFQTIKMIRKPNGSRPEFIALAAGDVRTWKAQLFIAQHPKEASLTEGWKVVKRINLNDSKDENDLWHPGGLDICGKYLAIPIEDWMIKKYLSKELYPGVLTHYEPRSKIIFFDISDPLNPKRLKVAIERNNGFCPAVAFTRLNNGKFLVYTNGAGDIHISKTARLEDGFEQSGKLEPRVSGQNLSFVTIGDKGDLYMVATENSKDTAPVLSGNDMAYLHKFEYDPETKTGSINKVAQKSCDCGEGFNLPGKVALDAGWRCNFNAAGNVTPMGGLLGLYHYVVDGKYLNCTLFGPDLENPEKVVEEFLDVLGGL